jgi:hypothetical protein
MSHNFQLFEHLSALKKYLLLGQGDFIAILLESVASNLDRPANSQYRHHLTSALDHSIRNSNAQFESQEIIRRLDARMLELSHGEIGWDVFTLEYRMDSPLDVIVGPWAQKQYLKIFNFLWRIKRVEFSLGQIWGRCMTGSRGVLRFIHQGSRKARHGGEEDELRATWKRARGGLAAMVHFVGQLQYYILFEVIESGWEKLKAEMAKVCLLFPLMSFMFIDTDIVVALGNSRHPNSSTHGLPDLHNEKRSPGPLSFFSKPLLHPLSDRRFHFSTPRTPETDARLQRRDRIPLLPQRSRVHPSPRSDVNISSTKR